MAEKYFNKFPIINYNGHSAVNITERISLLDTVAKNPYLYYTYDLSNQIRPDRVAEVYYNDPYMDWLVYLSNKTIDPYYDWYLSQNNFNAFIEKKYGSIEIAQQTILYYRNNWYENLNETPVAGYESFPINIQKYYEPVFGANGNIIAYQRKKEDWIINNPDMVISITITDNSIYELGEPLTLTFYSQSKIGHNYIQYNVIVETGNVLNFENNILTINNISNYHADRSFVGIFGEIGHYESDFSLSALTVNKINNLPLDEQVYYSPVTAYDYENEKNESKKSIKLLDNSYAMQTAIELKKLL